MLAAAQAISVQFVAGLGVGSSRRASAAVRPAMSGGGESCCSSGAGAGTYTGGRGGSR